METRYGICDFFLPIPGTGRTAGKEERKSMGGLKKVSRNDPCPICGKPDYCFWKERKRDPGLYNLYCNRTSEPEGVIVMGKDGKEYAAIHQSDRGTIYESVTQREERSRQKVSGERKEAVPRKYTVLDSVSPLPHEKLDVIYRALMEELPLLAYHARYLAKEGWSLNLMQKHRICSFPAERMRGMPFSIRYLPDRETLARKVMEKLSLNSLKGVPGAYLNDAGKWTFCAKSGILFPVYDADGLIYRLRIRLDYLDLPVKMEEDERGFYYMDKEQRITVSMSGPFKEADGERIFMEFSSHRGKYRNFSSYIEDSAAYDSGFIVNTLIGGCEARNQILYAMDPEDDYRVMWIIEGEKKALFSNHVIRQPFLALPGVNDYGRLGRPVHGKTPLDRMRQKGCQIAVIAYDADRYHNEAVMSFQNRLADLLKACGFTVFIADWNEVHGKGLDDLLASGHLPVFYEYPGSALPAQAG